MKRRRRPDPGTRAGVSESILEMAAEHLDPAMWATMREAVSVVRDESEAK